jgi:histidine triad (HIT) family protein
MPKKRNRDRCVFCEIARHEIPAYIVYEDNISVAFLDYRPLYEGHTLIVPKLHIPTIMDFPPELLGDFFNRVKLISRAVEISMSAEGIFNCINNRISQSVPHLHTHIIPRRRKDGMRNFLWPRGKYESEETAETIRLLINQTADTLVKDGFLDE